MGKSTLNNMKHEIIRKLDVFYDRDIRRCMTLVTARDGSKEIYKKTFIGYTQKQIKSIVRQDLKTRAK